MTDERLRYYMRQPWTDETDCYHWFREIQRLEFGRDFPILAGYKRVFRAARLMAEMPDVLGAVRTDSPRDGDAAFLTQRSRPHHIGLVLWIDGKLRILHAPEGGKIVCSTMQSLKMNGWRVDGYWTL